MYKQKQKKNNKMTVLSKAWIGFASRGEAQITKKAFPPGLL